MFDLFIPGLVSEAMNQITFHKMLLTMVRVHIKIMSDVGNNVKEKIILQTF